MSGAGDDPIEIVTVSASRGTGSQTQRPRFVVKLNGAQTVPLSAHVLNNSHFQADTFSFELPAFDPNFGLAFWDAQETVQVEILLGFLAPGDDASATPSNLMSLVTGEVDDIDLQLDTGITTLTGRDLTGRLIDNKISQISTQQTASQIVTTLAGQVGLTPDVTATSTPVGAYSNAQVSSSIHDQPMWDYITYLAEQEGFDAYVTGNTLYFGPPAADGTPFPLQFSRDPVSGAVDIDTVRLKLHRSLTLAKDITVTVLSYDRSHKQPIKAVAKRQGSAKSGSTSFRTGSTSQNYTIRRTGLNQAQAQDLAQNTLDDLSKHERTLDGELPSDDGTLTSRSIMQLSGTNTGWDTKYYVDTVTREFAFGSLETTFTAKNHQIESQPDS